jgi:hypothetical protein
MKMIRIANAFVPVGKMITDSDFFPWQVSYWGENLRSHVGVVRPGDTVFLSHERDIVTTAKARMRRSRQTAPSVRDCSFAPRAPSGWL